MIGENVNNPPDPYISDLEKVNGISEVLTKSYEACKKVGELIGSSYGPNGSEKLLPEKTESELITSNTVAILKSIKIPHPAVKLIIFSTIFQDQEMGDSSGFLFLFSIELLSNAIQLLNRITRKSNNIT